MCCVLHAVAGFRWIVNDVWSRKSLLQMVFGYRNRSHLTGAATISSHRSTRLSDSDYCPRNVRINS